MKIKNINELKKYDKLYQTLITQGKIKPEQKRDPQIEQKKNKIKLIIKYLF